ncbi:hypothetical protein BD310DRAFT_813896 [Dichomitus squalens]|uniref:Transmembrane protein n=1 Tax=Dichomitus squalens TaxID=114155 RepID=A0A4Q9Q207_9APHY|nr:hypothetical protein BD310DRAFT_813896 [Dichomitus squalens]
MIALVVLASNIREGIAVPRRLTAGVPHYALKSVPVLISLIIQCSWSVVREEIQKMQFLVNLSRHGEAGETAKKTIDLNYAHQNLFVCTYTSRQNRDWLVFWACLLSLIILALQPFSVALFSVRITYVSSISQVGLNPQAYWIDMNAFLGASGFATARVLYDLSYPPFVDSHGYTIEEFELPAVTNGTVYADVSAVHYQASCLSPTDSWMVSVEGTTMAHCSATFEECQFSWDITDASTISFGSATLPDNSGCQNYTNIPLQFRPVVFYFADGPSHSISAVLCRPGISVSEVSVAVDLASKTTTIVSRIDVRSPIVTQQSVYNGLFFDEDSLDVMAYVRLQAIQQQLPGAISLQAARAQNTSLADTLAHNGLADITASIYNTYLSLVAKTIYFVDAQQPVTILSCPNTGVAIVRLGAWCDRLFMVPVFVSLVSVSLFALALGGIIIQLLHQDARSRLALPRNYTTPRSFFQFAGDLEAQYRVAAVQRSERAGQDAGELRLTISPKTGRITVVADPRDRRAPSLSSDLAGSLEKDSGAGKHLQGSLFATRRRTHRGHERTLLSLAEVDPRDFATLVP